MKNGKVEKDLDQKTSFVDYLSTEIEQIREDQKTPGWTNWAIIGAMAPLTWLIILELEKNRFAIEQVYLLLIVLALAIETILIPLKFIKPNKDNSIQYNTINAIFSEESFNILFATIRNLLLVILIVYFENKISRGTYLLALTFFGMAAIEPLILLIGYSVIKKRMKMDIYFPLSSNINTPIGFPFLKKYRKIKLGRFIVLVLWIIIGYLFISYSMLLNNTYGLTFNQTYFSSIKISVLFSAIILLIRILANSGKKHTLLDNLIKIRRDLQFGNIDLEMAEKLAKVSLSGLSKSDAVRIELTKCISTLQKISIELGRAKKKIVAVSELLAESIVHDTEYKESLWEPIRDNILVDFKQAKKIYESDKSLQGGLNYFLLLQNMFEPMNLDFAVHFEELGGLFDEVKGKYDNTISEWLKLVYDIEGEDRAKKWEEIAVKELEADLPEKLHVSIVHPQ